MAFETIHSETVYRGRAFQVRKDQVRLPDGRPVNLDIVDHRGSVSLVPVDADGQIWFVRQYRYPAGKSLLELPAGVMEEGEEAEFSAHREIREEIGMAAGQLQALGGFYLAPGYSTEYMVAFLATNLTHDPLQPDEDEILNIEKLPLQQALQMAESGQIEDSKTLASLLLARPFLEKD
ncbi:MAG TPA: NUDIX hydrolase [Anaerolineales bacterium]